MKRSEMTRIGAALLLIAGLATPGCGAREEPGEIASTPEIPSTPIEISEPEATSDSTAEAEALEAELEQAKAELVERMQELDRKMFELEELELGAARAEVEPGIVDESAIPADDAIAANDAIAARMRVAPGAPIDIEFMDALSSELSEIGNTVRAKIVGGAVPAGTTLWGHVTDVRSERKIGSSARLALAFEEMELPSGQLVPIQAELLLEGARQKNKDAATIGGAAAGGAILGRVLSKNRKKGKSTAIGAIVGAAVGAVIAKENRGAPIVVEPGQSASLELIAPAEWTALETPAALVAREY